MKKVWSIIGIVFVCVLVVIGTISTNSLSEANALVETLQDSAVIVIGENASEQEVTAAEVLQKYISGVVDFTPSIQRDNIFVDGYIISVGQTIYTERNVTNLQDGSYRIGKIANGSEIVGAGKRGLIYGVYAFLETYGGYHFYTNDQGMFSEQNYIALPEDDVSYDTYFEYTDTDWKSPRDFEYSVANGLSGNGYRTIPESYGGNTGYIGPYCHTLSTNFCSRDIYFESHPEYFAYHDGKRTSKQLCLTNENVIDIVTQEVFGLLMEEHDPTVSLQIISLTQDDNEEYCECEACKKTDEENGSHAGTMISFVNKIADRVKNAGYNNVAIDTFAYRYTRKTPTKVVPNDNVIVRLCTIECCFSHPFDEVGCPENESFMNDLSDWSKICNRLYIWDYTTNYANTIGLFPDFGVLQKNIQIFYEHNVKGIYEEGNYYIGACNAEFGELRSYLISRLLQNPYCDYDKIMNDFIYAYYGSGGIYIREFIDKMTENANKHHVFIYSSMKSSLSFNYKEIKECNALWEKAKQGANEEELSHILRSELSWRYWKACCDKDEFFGFKKFESRRKLIDDLQSFGVTKFNEGCDISYRDYLQYLSIDYWGESKVELAFTEAIINIINPLVIAVILLFAVVLIILGIKKKNYINIVYLIGLLIYVGLSVWHQDMFISWINPPLYYVASVLVGLVFSGLIALLLAKKNKKSILTWSGTGLVYYLITNVGLLMLLNTVVFDYEHNTLAFAIAYLCLNIALLCSISYKTICSKRKATKKIDKKSKKR